MSEADLFSKIRRKVVRAVWVYIRFLISRVRPAHSFVGSGSILENPSQSCACCLGIYPFPHQSSAPGTLLRRKLIYPRKTVAKLCELFGRISVPSSVECARHTPSSEADLSSKIRRKVVRAVWVLPAPVRKTGLLLHNAASPALRAWVVLSVMDVMPPQLGR